INPYGKTKLMVENILHDYSLAYGLNYSALRYFNAAGASPSGCLGERHNPETHLIPLIMQTASGRRETISIYGEDYETFDGTCVRDFIHVVDLCDAHIRAVEYLIRTGVSQSFNLGNGVGFSVREVIETAKSVTGKAFKVINAPRRNGDPATLVADSTLAKSELDWSPKYCDLETIVRHAWQWEKYIGRK
ncbi:MAG: NAD-dependent epimerase/dehydratase family protein, partial [Candidatus Paceibacterota bacterium]